MLLKYAFNQNELELFRQCKHTIKRLSCEGRRNAKLFLCNPNIVDINGNMSSELRFEMACHPWIKSLPVSYRKKMDKEIEKQQKKAEKERLKEERIRDCRINRQDADRFKEKYTNIFIKDCFKRLHHL